MNIAIVCGHFLPSMGYIEVHLANVLHNEQHNVKVFTSKIIPDYVKGISQIADSTPYPVIRLNSYFSMGQMVKTKELVNAVEEFNPSMVICIGVGKLFPKPLYQLKKRSFKLITLLGDNEETYTTKSSIKKLKNSIIQYVFKKKVYLAAIKSSDLLLPYTPSTLDIISQFVDASTLKDLKSKSHQISLGFDEKQFFFDEFERNEQRKKLGIAESENLLVTATRVAPEKGLESIIDLVENINKKGININYLIIGFQGDDYANELLKYISTKEYSHRIITKEFIPTSQLRKYYNAADIGIFNRAAISIFEALATGLYLLLPSQKNISHILSNDNGVYFNKISETTLMSALNQAHTNRLEREKDAKQFSYRNLAQQIIQLSEV